LNLPAATYTQQQIAAWQQLLYPDGTPAAAAEQSIERAADAAIVAAAEAAAAAAPAEAALFSGEQPPPYGSWVSSWNGIWTMSFRGALLKGQKKFSMHVRNGVQAACAADLARLAIHGLTPAAAAELNFPASVYTQQQVADMAALLQVKRPMLQLAGVEACSSKSTSGSSTSGSGVSHNRGSSSSSSGTRQLGGPPTDSSIRSAERVKQRAVLRAAADAAVADAAAAAAATEAAARFSNNAGDGPPYGSCVVWYKNRYWRIIIRRFGGKRFERTYSSRLHAACAADLAQLALGGTAVNILPGSLYTQQHVAAMRQLLLFERPAWSATAGGRSKLFAGAAADVAVAEAAAAAAAKSAALVRMKLAVLDAAAAVVQMAPEQAAAVSAAQQLHSCFKIGPSWQGRVYVQFMGCAAQYVPVLTSRDAAAAACASDLARLATRRRSKPKLNFPEHVYSSEQVAAFGALLAACYPRVRLADAVALSRSSSSSSSGSSGADSTANDSCFDSTDAARSSSTRDRGSQAAAAGDGSSDVELDQQQPQQQQQRGAAGGIVVAATAVLLAADALCVAQRGPGRAATLTHLQQKFNSSTSSSALLQQQQQLAGQQRWRLHAEQLSAAPMPQTHQVPLPQLVSCCSSRGWRSSKRLGASGVSSQLRANAAAVGAVLRTGNARCW
jgi:hypothetical protein